MEIKTFVVTTHDTQSRESESSSSEIAEDSCGNSMSFAPNNLTGGIENGTCSRRRGGGGMKNDLILKWLHSYQ